MSPTLQAVDEQAIDDIALLDQMMTELKRAEGVFQTTSYWQYYERKFVPYLRRHGLRGFRSGSYASGGETFWAFGAPDAFPEQRKRRFPSMHSLRRMIGGRDDTRLQLNSIRKAEVDAQLAESRQRKYQFVAKCGQENGALPLSWLSASEVGGPVDIWTIDDRLMTSSLLYYYLRYAYTARFFDLPSSQVIVELGSGAGKQAEVLAKLHPHLTLLLF